MTKDLSKQLKEMIESFNKDLEADQQVPYQELKEYVEKLEKKAKVLEKDLSEKDAMNKADLANLTRKNNEVNAEIRKYGGANIAEAMIKPIDLLKKVISSPAPNEEVKNYLIGFEMILKQMEQALENNGITLIEVKPGDKFDFRIHSANEAVEGTEFEEDTIVQVLSNGYKIYDKVLIHANVKVAK